MQFNVRFVCAIVIVLVYLLIRSVSWENEERSPISHNRFLPSRVQNSSLDVTSVRKNVTVVLRYVGGDGQCLSHTINSFSLQFPKIPILLVSDSVIAAHFSSNFSKSANVKAVHIKLDLLNLISDRNPASYITTKYMLLVPCGVGAVTPQQMLTLFDESTKTNIMILPVHNTTKCMSLDLNLREWTMEVQVNKYNPRCEYVDSDSGIFMKTLELRNMAEPFMVPCPESLLIQAKAASIKTALSAVHLQQHKNHTTDDHMRHYLQHQRTYSYSLFGIKKVVRERLIEWYGCTRETSRCFGTVVESMPHYLYDGRWTPPCCLRVLRDTAKHVFRTLEKHNVRYWLEGGSLLGAMRSKDIIPWDYDVDVGIYLPDMKNCPWLIKAQLKSMQGNSLGVTDEDGYVWKSAKTEEGEFFRVQSSSSNTLHVDIFPFYSRNGIMTKDTWMLSHPQDREFPEHYLKPLTTVEFIGVNASAPNNIREFLEFKFGKGCVENPQYPNPKLMTFPQQEKSDDQEFIDNY